MLPASPKAAPAWQTHALPQKSLSKSHKTFPKGFHEGRKRGGSPWECLGLCKEELLVRMFWEVMLWAVLPS